MNENEMGNNPIASTQNTHWTPVMGTHRFQRVQIRLTDD